jgi:adenosylcobinamide kinase/adenosylcobinamide-phosphate guanylyltransferase
MSDPSANVLVIGHASSGKSAWAEGLVSGWDGRSVYFATSRILDDEIRGKVEVHCARRGGRWTTRDVPVELARALEAAAAGDAVLVDCATMWLSNLMEDGAPWEAEARALVAALAATPARVCVVTNDVGGGIVPANALARRFQRAQGELNQTLAAAMGHVVLVTAGLPLALKGGLPR